MLTKQLSDLRQGAEFTYAGTKWTKLAEVNNVATNIKGTVSITSNNIGCGRFDNINNIYDKSDMRDYLITDFMEELANSGANSYSDMLPIYIIHGIASNTYDKISLFSASEFATYRDLMPRDKSKWWLRSPASININVQYVEFDGRINMDGAHVTDALSIRPVVSFKPELYVYTDESELNDDAILKNAIVTFGEEAQQRMCVEEMSELTKAICKYWRYHTQDKLDDILEEIADVKIMMRQMNAMFGNTTKIEAKKIERLRLRLEKEVEGF